MKARCSWFVSFLTSKGASKTLRIYFIALAFAGPALTADIAYADASTVPQTYMGQSATTAQSKLGNLGNYLVVLTNKAWMTGLLVLLLVGIAGAILWAFGQRGVVINVLGAVVIIGIIVMVIALVADIAANGA
jgi:hypothetical protein